MIETQKTPADVLKEVLDRAWIPREDMKLALDTLECSFLFARSGFTPPLALTPIAIFEKVLSLTKLSSRSRAWYRHRFSEAVERVKAGRV